MRRSSVPLILLLLLFHIFVTRANAEGPTFVILRQIEDDTLTLERYQPMGTTTIDVSDLTIWDQIKDKSNVFSTYYTAATNFRTLLLQLGYAKLKVNKNGTSQDIEAQDAARSKKVGMWREEPTAPTGEEERSVPQDKPPTTDSEPLNWHNVMAGVWDLVVALVGLILFSWVGKELYRTFYIQRRCKLLIIGEPSTGKTALLYNLVNPNVPKERILQLTESRAVTREKKGAIIPRGKFEILPELADIPGAAFGTVWDTLLGSYNHALVTVVAPQRINGVRDGQVRMMDITTNVDQRYVDIQIGYVQAYVEGGLGSTATKKPKVLIMFISKFDLYSKLPPYDSGAEKVKEKVLDIFCRAYK